METIFESDFKNILHCFEERTHGKSKIPLSFNKIRFNFENL